jgi:hypothetical protein
MVTAETIFLVLHLNNQKDRCSGTIPPPLCNVYSGGSHANKKITDSSFRISEKTPEVWEPVDGSISPVSYTIDNQFT